MSPSHSPSSRRPLLSAIKGIIQLSKAVVGTVPLISGQLQAIFGLAEFIVDKVDEVNQGKENEILLAERALGIASALECPESYKGDSLLFAASEIQKFAQDISATMDDKPRRTTLKDYFKMGNKSSEAKALSDQLNEKLEIFKLQSIIKTRCNLEAQDNAIQRIEALLRDIVPYFLGSERCLEREENTPQSHLKYQSPAHQDERECRVNHGYSRFHCIHGVSGFENDAQDIDEYFTRGRRPRKQRSQQHPKRADTDGKGPFEGFENAIELDEIYASSPPGYETLFSSAISVKKNRSRSPPCERNMRKPSVEKNSDILPRRRTPSPEAMDGAKRWAMYSLDPYYDPLSELPMAEFKDETRFRSTRSIETALGGDCPQSHGENTCAS